MGISQWYTARSYTRLLNCDSCNFVVPLQYEINTTTANDEQKKNKIKSTARQQRRGYCMLFYIPVLVFGRFRSAVSGIVIGFFFFVFE